MNAVINYKNPGSSVGSNRLQNSRPHVQNSVHIIRFFFFSFRFIIILNYFKVLLVLNKDMKQFCVALNHAS